MRFFHEYKGGSLLRITEQNMLQINPEEGTEGVCVFLTPINFLAMRASWSYCELAKRTFSLLSLPASSEGAGPAVSQPVRRGGTPVCSAW